MATQEIPLGPNGNLRNMDIRKAMNVERNWTGVNPETYLQSRKAESDPLPEEWEELAELDWEAR